MKTSVKLNQLNDTLATLDYPATKEEAISHIGDTILQYADGEERLGNVISRSTAEVYEDRDELDSEIRSNLATSAVGEPGQSEGEG